VTEEKQLPSASDSVGTRYVRDSDGDVIVDRRERSRSVLVGVLLALLLMISGLSLLGYFQQRADSESREHDTEKALFEIRAGQRLSCENSGNTLREGLREFMATQIENQRTIDPALFPDIPRATFHALVGERIAQLRALQRRHFAAVDCAQVHPLLDDPDTEEDEAGT